MEWIVGLLVTAAVGVTWVIADLRYYLACQTALATLAGAGRVTELLETCEQGLAARRPFLVIGRKYLLPGLMETECALYYHNAGLQDRAIQLAETGEKLAGQDAMRAAALSVQVLALASAGRMEDARVRYLRLRQMNDVPAALLICGANLALSTCEYAEAISVCDEVLRQSPDDEAAQGVRGPSGFPPRSAGVPIGAGG